MKRSRPPFRPRAASRRPIEVDIADVGVRGDGLAAWEGKRLFVPFALAGERVRAEIVGETADAIQARLIEVVRPAGARVVPLCRHFGDCGGCSLQHLAPEGLAEWKRRRVAAALGQRGMEAKVAETVSIAPGTRRRAVFAYRVVGGGAVIGFNARASGRIVDQRQCPLLDPRLAGLVDPLRTLMAGLQPPGAAGDVAAMLTDDGVDLCLDLTRPPSADAFERLGDFGRAHDLARLSWRQGGRIEPAAVFRTPVLSIGGVAVEVPPAAFLQASREGEAAIAERVDAAVGDAFPAADLFCGIGTFGLRLAAKGDVHAFDGDAGLVAALAQTRRVGCAVRDLFSNPLSGPELAGFRSVVFDPPRAGAKAQAEALAIGGPPVVAAVSCNPATFARDARILVDGGYRLEWIVPIDQFPWSAHVEVVARFTR